MKYLVALPFEAFTPTSIAAGIDVWTWVISEQPEYEIGVMMEINSAWLATVRFERGMFSTSQKYPDLYFSSLVDTDKFALCTVAMTRSFARSSTAQQTRKRLIAGWPARSGC
jgi:hypothetical protein